MELTLKGSPKFISSSPVGKFYLITFSSRFRGILPLKICQKLNISFDFKPPWLPLIKVWSAVMGWGAIIRLNLTPKMAPIAMITTVKTDLKRPVRLQCQFGWNLIFETIWMRIGEEGETSRTFVLSDNFLSATNHVWALESYSYDDWNQKWIMKKWIPSL